MPSNPKPVRMWGWTDKKGRVLRVSPYRDMLFADHFGGTRIRVTVVPDKKHARKCRACDGTGVVETLVRDKPARKRCNCNSMGLVTSPCGFAMDPCANPKCKRSVAYKKPAKSLKERLRAALTPEQRERVRAAVSKPAKKRKGKA